MQLIKSKEYICRCFQIRHAFPQWTKLEVLTQQVGCRATWAKTAKCVVELAREAVRTAEYHRLTKTDTRDVRRNDISATATNAIWIKSLVLHGCLSVSPGNSNPPQSNRGRAFTSGNVGRFPIGRRSTLSSVDLLPRCVEQAAPMGRRRLD